MIGDPFLNYFALGLLVFVVVVIFYGIIAIHDIPAKIAETRHHPHAGRYPCRRLGEPVHPACAVAVPLDLGDGIPSGTRLGLFRRSRCPAPLQRQRKRNRGSCAVGLPSLKRIGRTLEADHGASAHSHLRCRFASSSSSSSAYRSTNGLFRRPCWAEYSASRCLLLIMNYNHPFTTNARIYFPVTPILPTVKGRVVEVPVQANTPLKEGDVLFRVDPKPFQYVVDEKESRTRGSRAECRSAKGITRSSDCGSGKGECAAPAGAAEL